MYSDIGIMQKLSSRIENSKTFYYTGAYCGDFTCIIKSDDLITWEYVSQPDFINCSQWENATYVLNDKVYYFVRQQNTDKYGFLTAFDLNRKEWRRGSAARKGLVQNYIVGNQGQYIRQVLA